MLYIVAQFSWSALSLHYLVILSSSVPFLNNLFSIIIIFFFIILYFGLSIHTTRILTPALSLRGSLRKGQKEEQMNRGSSKKFVTLHTGIDHMCSIQTTTSAARNYLMLLMQSGKIDFYNITRDTLDRSALNQANCARLNSSWHCYGCRNCLMFMQHCFFMFELNCRVTLMIVIIYKEIQAANKLLLDNSILIIDSSSDIRKVGFLT